MNKPKPIMRPICPACGTVLVDLNSKFGDCRRCGYRASRSHFFTNRMSDPYVDSGGRPIKDSVGQVSKTPGSDDVA